MDKYYVYVMSNKNNTALYVGVTNDIERRVVEHRTYDIKSFTSRYNCHKLVYIEEYSSINEAYNAREADQVLESKTKGCYDRRCESFS